VSAGVKKDGLGPIDRRCRVIAIAVPPADDPELILMSGGKGEEVRSAGGRIGTPNRLASTSTLSASGAPAGAARISARIVP
jgi:hypothetical protein